MYIFLLVAAAVRGQLDAGLRSRIRFPPQLPGRHVVWEGHPRVGLGNVLAGWGDLYYKATARDKTILVGLDHAITRDLSRFFTLSVDNETVTSVKPHRVRSGLVYDGFVDAAAARRFNVTSAHCRPGKLQVKQALAGDYAGSMSVKPEQSLPCGFREALRALIIDHLGDRTELDRAQAMGHSRAVPYLDWWALANSADIVVRRHAGCIAQASTFSTTARAWGLDVERASKRARPDFDGLV